MPMICSASVMCKEDHVTAAKARPDQSDDDAHSFICACTCRKSWPGPGCLHLLPCVGQHVVTLGFIDQISTRFRRFDQLLVVHYIEKVGRVDEG